MWLWSLGSKQNNVLVQRLQKLQQKAVWLIHFETNPNVLGQLLQVSNLKLTDFIKYNYALFIRNSLRKEIFQYLMMSTLSLIRIMSITQRDQQIKMPVVPHIQTTHYGEHSFKSRSINSWNLCQRNLKTDLITCDFATFKKLIFQYHLNQYQLWV